jgi:hypothetical protein
LEKIEHVVPNVQRHAFFERNTGGNSMLQRFRGHKPNSAPAWHQRLFLAFLPLAAIIVLAFVLVLPAAAATFINTDIPISGTLPNPCNGENVTLSGVEHLQASVTSTSDPATFHLDVHENFHVAGFGDQGNTYVANAEDSSELNAIVNVEATFSQKLSVISQGSAPNFEMYAIVHLTIHPGFIITGFVDNETSTCLG